MEQIKKFSIKRIFLLMQKTVYENSKFVLIGLVTVFGIFSVILLMSGVGSGDAMRNMEAFYVIGFVISGIFISGMAFTNLRVKEKTISYLTLPASTLEKFISELLLTTIGFVLMYTVIFYIYNFVVYLIGSSFNVDVNIINIFGEEVLEGYLKYLILQSIFLAGAATFRKIPVFFTAFSLFSFGIVILVFVVILAVSMKGYFVDIGTPNVNFKGNNFNMDIDIENHFLIRFPKFMFYYLTAPIFWLVTYFKLKEKEV